VLFVDDGSSDATADLVEKLLAERPDSPLTLLRQPHRGKGAAVAAGLAAAETPWAGFCDLDLSTPLPHLERILDTAKRAGGLAIGSRDLPGSRLLRPEGHAREFLGRAYNRLLQALLTPGISDTQCGAKAASREVWAVLLDHCREPGLAWDAELIAVARAVGIRVHEVPVDWSHDDRTRVRVGRDGLAMVAATPRIWRNARRAARTKAATTDPATAAAPVEAGEVFDDVNAERLMEADAEHWWFRSKAAFVASSLRRFATPRGEGWLVDIGAGAGGVTSRLGWPRERTLVVEGSAPLVHRAGHRHGLAAAQALVHPLPVADGAASVACFLDVLEHLDDPGAALRETRRALRPGGLLVVTVPAHRWLWSEADELLGHVRRYTRSTLRRELEAAGFTPSLLSHVFSWLVAPVWVTRRLGRGGPSSLGLDRSSPLLDAVALVLTTAERAACRRVPIPFGTSILCVARPTPSK
jgi:2-polyprenyl-3-methyl-5-hydroxy-6-metoxy-1,4-benzoquinol methylase